MAKELNSYCVYGIFNTYRNLIYIGYTGNLKPRMRQHKKTKGAHSYLVIFEGDKDTCLKVEVSLIKLFTIHIDDSILNKTPDFGKEMYLTEL